MEWNGIFYATHPEVYEPSDDTFLLAKVVGDEVRAGDKFLEIGCGTGVVSIAAGRKGAQVTATDANPHAVRLAWQNGRQNVVGVHALEADLMQDVPGPFDVVAFNPPYLPTAEDERVTGPLNLAFDGGESGNDVVLKLVDQLEAASWKPRLVLIIHSSLSDPTPLIGRMESLGYVADIAADEKHFMERLTVRRFTLA
jgi:release factor glutamine methyltransferase